MSEDVEIILHYNPHSKVPARLKRSEKDAKRLFEIFLNGDFDETDDNGDPITCNLFLAKRKGEEGV